MARPVHRDGSLAVVGLLHPKMALLRLEDRDRLAAARDFHQGFDRVVVRPSHILGADETEIIPGDAEASARLQGHVFFDLVALDTARADREHPDTEMSDAHAEQCGRHGLFLTPPAHGFEHRGEYDPEAEAEADQYNHVELAKYQPLVCGRQSHRYPEEPPQRIGGHRELAAPPGRMHAD